MEQNGKRTILLVEDEALIAMAEKQQLEKYAYRVLIANSGEKAVQTIEDDTHPIDLVLMDIDLGSGIDGTEAAQQIIQQKEIPVVFLSSHTEPQVVDKTEKITSYGYVVKNSGPTVLDASIKMAFKLFDANKKTITSEERYHQLFHNSPYAVALHEMIFDDAGASVDYRFIAVNPAFETITGLKADEVVNRRVLEVLPATEQYWIDTLGEVARTGVSVNVENYAQALGKQVKVTVFQPKENQVATIFGDITERKQTEDILRRSEEKYRLLFDTMSPGVVYQSADGTVISANPAAERILGLTVDQMAGKTSMDPRWKMIDEEGNTVPGPAHPAMVALRTGEPVGPVDRAVFVPEKNEYVWISVTAIPLFKSGEDRPYQVYATFENITQRKQSEEKLRESEERYASLFNHAVGAIYVHDFDGSIIDVNDAACEQTGYSKSELLQLSVFDIHVTGQDTINQSKADTMDIWKRSKVGERHSFDAEHRRKCGTVYPVRLSTGAIHFGNKIAIMAIVEDITEGKQAEQKIQRQLAESETLLREVHHRIKNNMAQVESLLSLQADSADSAEVESALHKAMSRVRSTRVLYEKLLVGKGHQEVSMKDYLESLIESHAEVYNDHAGVSIETNIVDFPLSSKKAIPIGIIVNELLTNVFKYAFGNRPEGRVLIKLDKNDGRVTLTVKDDGIGFDSRVSANKSTGFGLTLTAMLAEQLHGTFSTHCDNGTRSIVEFEI